MLELFAPMVFLLLQVIYSQYRKTLAMLDGRPIPSIIGSDAMICRQ